MCSAENTNHLITSDSNWNYKINECWSQITKFLWLAEITSWKNNLQIYWFNLSVWFIFYTTAPTARVSIYTWHSTKEWLSHLSYCEWTAGTVSLIPFYTVLQIPGRQCAFSAAIETYSVPKAQASCTSNHHMSYHWLRTTSSQFSRSNPGSPV